MCRLHKCDSQYCVPLGWDKEVTNTNKPWWATKQNLEAPTNKMSIRRQNTNNHNSLCAIRKIWLYRLQSTASDTDKLLQYHKQIVMVNGIKGSRQIKQNIKWSVTLANLELHNLGLFLLINRITIDDLHDVEKYPIVKLKLTMCIIVSTIAS